MQKNMNETGMQKKRRGRILFLAVFVLVFAIGTAAVYIFREEIALVYYALTTPEEVVQSQKVENDKKTNELLHEIVPDVTMRDLTDEERAMLASGSLSYEEALALIRGETFVPATTAVPIETTVPEVVATTAPEKPAVTVSVTSAVSEPQIPQTGSVTVTTATTVSTPAAVTTTAATTTATTAETTTVTEKIDLADLQRRQEEIIAEIYLLRATYLNEIDALILNGKKEYGALPKEKHNLSTKMQMAQKIVAKGRELEAQCDEKMEKLLSELSDILISLGKDTQTVSDIRAMYSEQKEIKSAELYNEYMPHLKK